MRELCSGLAVSLLFLFHLTSGNPRGWSKPEVPEEVDTDWSSKTFGHRFGRSKKPHIVVILADDLGWNDVSFHGSNQIPTPNIDAIAYNGIILNSHYVSAMCTPSRSALMTGKHPIHLGMQHSVLLEPEPRGLPLEEKLLPEYLRDAGYRTHAIGKWHLGYYKREYTPTYRGFDSHFGYWNGFQDYFTHTVQSSQESYWGFDMRRNMTVAWDTQGKYSTDVFTEEAVRVIDGHDARVPLFMYLAHNAPHAGNTDDPYQAPDEEIAKFSYIDDPERRVYAAMVSKLDESVGEVTAALRRRGMLDNSIILFMSDNGAPTMGIHNNSGSNYPLRGIKNSPWEGGVRGAAAIWSPLIKKPRRVSNQLISITDWLPTLWSAAGMDASALGSIDGYNMWPSLVNDRRSPRAEVLINIDDIDNYSAIRRGDYKYVIGHTDSGDEWYGDSAGMGLNEPRIAFPEVSPDTVLNSRAGIAISGAITAEQVTTLRKRREARWQNNDDEKLNNKLLTATDITRLRRDSILRCNVRKQQEVRCHPVESPCLFNIKEDPCEMINIAEKNPVILTSLEHALFRHRLTAVPASNVDNDPRANPVNWKGIWVNWRDPDPFAPDLRKCSSSRFSGSTIALIGVLLAVVIVAAMTLFAIRHSNLKNFQSSTENGPSPVPNEEAVPITGRKIDERTSEIDSSGAQTLTGQNSTKELGKDID